MKLHVDLFRVKGNQLYSLSTSVPIMAYMGRLRPKGVPFSGFRCMKG